jgi:SSS family solute:Na+ symporter
MVYGTITAYNVEVPKTVTKLVDGEPVTEVLGTRHFGGSLADFPFTDTKVYIALTALLINIVVAVVLTAILRAANVPDGTDGTSAEDYYADPPAVVKRSQVTA